MTGVLRIRHTSISRRVCVSTPFAASTTIYFIRAVIESHHRRGHRDTTLLLDFHPVGSSGLLDFIAFYGTGHMNGATEKQKFLGKGSFAGIRVRYDGESAPALYFFVKQFVHLE